jgi:protein phosphatase
MELKVGTVCDRGLNPRRPVNQDRFLALAERGLFAVFDGVGGQRAGEVASQTAAETIEEALAHTSANSSSDLICRAVEFANRDIFEMAQSNPEYRTMATTVALVYIDDSTITVAHVGDSRVYLLEGGRLTLETIDHTDLNDDLRAGKITRAEAARQIERNVINRALGVEPDVDVELKTIRAGEGARFLLCSDGIYKHLGEDEIARALAENEDPQRAADELKRLVYERGADDNLTALVVQLGRARKPLAARRAEKSLSAQAAGVGLEKLPSARNRIQVDFGSVEQKDESRDYRQLDPSSGRISFDEPEEGTSTTRKIIYTLVALVLLAGAFYAGLRASDLARARSSPSPQPAIEVIDPMKTGREAFDRGEFQRAAVEFDSVIKRDPKDADARYWMGRAQMEQGEYEKASQNFEEAIKLQPALQDAYVQAAAAYSVVGKKDKADRMLRLYAEQRRRDGRSSHSGR